MHCLIWMAIDWELAPKLQDPAFAIAVQEKPIVFRLCATPSFYVFAVWFIVQSNEYWCVTCYVECCWITLMLSCNHKPLLPSSRLPVSLSGFPCPFHWRKWLCVHCRVNGFLGNILIGFIRFHLLISFISGASMMTVRIRVYLRAMFVVCEI